jgi:hypothetical protein
MDKFKDLVVGDTVYKRSTLYGCTKHKIEAVFKQYLQLDDGEKYSFEGYFRPYSQGTPLIVLPSAYIEKLYQEDLTKKYRKYISKTVLDESLLDDAAIKTLIQVLTKLTPEHN